jgi:hypothetical protein
MLKRHPNLSLPSFLSDENKSRTNPMSFLVRDKLLHCDIHFSGPFLTDLIAIHLQLRFTFTARLKRELVSARPNNKKKYIQKLARIQAREYSSVMSKGDPIKRQRVHACMRACYTVTMGLSLKCSAGRHQKYKNVTH